MSDAHIPNRKYTYDELDRLRDATMKSRRWWSFATNSATIIVSNFSAISAVLAQLGNVSILNGYKAQNIVTILSLIVTVISAIQTKLGFERKWVASRSSHSALCQLKIDAEEGVPAPDIATGLKKIINLHDQTVIGK